MADDGKKARETTMMKRHTLAPWQHVLKRALPGSVAFSLMASLLMALTASCMACPTCTLALAKHSEKTDNTPLALLALLGAGKGNANKRIWVTAIDYNGNLMGNGGYAGAPGGANGILGADAKCNWATDGNWPGSGTYLAMIVDDTIRRACTNANCSSGPGEHAYWALQPNTTYYRGDGVTEIFTSNANGVWNFGTDGEWTNHITSPPPNPQVWTGLNADWTAASARCNNWENSNSEGAQGVSTGYSTYTSDHDIYAYNQLANGIGRIYCVEQ